MVCLIIFISCEGLFYAAILIFLVSIQRSLLHGCFLYWNTSEKKRQEQFWTMGLHLNTSKLEDF